MRLSKSAVFGLMNHEKKVVPCMDQVDQNPIKGTQSPGAPSDKREL